jgi:hypothetical protein
MDKKVLEKIKKCLALAASSNEHEASAAMRQAQKLMEMHGLTSTDVELSAIQSKTQKISNNRSLPMYQHMLINMIKDAFGVDAVHESVPTFGRFVSNVRFIGVEEAPELAGYTFDVLRRQLDRDRKAYLATLKRCKRATKVRRGDLFAESWVLKARQKVQNLQVPARHSELITQWKASNYGQLGEGKAISRTDKLAHNDYKASLLGAQAGASARLNPGMSGAAQPKRLR